MQTSTIMSRDKEIICAELKEMRSLTYDFIFTFIVLIAMLFLYIFRKPVCTGDFLQDSVIIYGHVIAAPLMIFAIGLLTICKFISLIKKTNEFNILKEKFIFKYGKENLPTDE